MEMGARHSDVGAEPSTSTSPGACADALASCTLITKSMEGVLERPGLLMLHRSKWRCLANSYSKEINLVHFFFFRLQLETRDQKRMLGKLARPLQALKQAVQEGNACMQDYIVPEDKHRSWLVQKAVKLAMSTDVVDVHLHNFLWVSSTVYHELLRLDQFSDSKIELMAVHVILRTLELRKIWEKVDAEDDLRIAQDLRIKLKGVRGKDMELVDFIIRKLSHVEGASHNHGTPDSVPAYMCVDSDQFLERKKQQLFKTYQAEIHQVVWLGGPFALKSFKHMDCNREAAIQARVCHSHVVPLVCFISKPPGLLMELMQEDLHALITKKKRSGQDPPFPLLMAVDLMLQIAKGMEYLHGDTLRIIHRDLKSHNILVSFPVNSHVGDLDDANGVNPQVHLKIADFGVSKAKPDSSVYTTRDQGTTLWMAPEVYDDGGSDSKAPTKYSNKADVYSFGMVCFEILTGSTPFEGAAVRSRVLQGERPRLPSDCPLALSSLIQMCWDADSSRRPTFTHICRALRYLKACIFLRDCHVGEANHEYALSSPLTSPDFSVKDILEVYLVETIQPPPLRIPWEMYLFGVGVHNPGHMRSALLSKT